ncbi:MAG: hypothetical protein HC829_07345, partial [Bacteroidales bacterium]|nr:hypothetical protein [Bacteroidales bacterium]
GRRLTDLLVTPSLSQTLAWASGFGDNPIYGASPESPLSFAARGSFEAAWTPDGAACMSHTRDGQALHAIERECSGQWTMASVDIGDGDFCVMRRKNTPVNDALLRNGSYGQSRARE